MQSTYKNRTAHYFAEQTCRIVLRGDTGSSLHVHELMTDGELRPGVPHVTGTRCGDRGRPWNGQPMEIVWQGPGFVTCGRCARKVA